jgi:uncharacterized protein YegP (UPF0339 family)
MTPKFEIVQDDSGKFTFHYKDKGGQVQLSSLTYSGKISAQTDVARVRKWLADDQRVVRHTRPNGEFFFTVKNEDGEVVARSMATTSEAHLEQLVQQVRTEAHTAALLDTTSKASRRHAHH